LFKLFFLILDININTMLLNSKYCSICYVQALNSFCGCSFFVGFNWLPTVCLAIRFLFGYFHELLFQIFSSLLFCYYTAVSPSNLPSPPKPFFNFFNKFFAMFSFHILLKVLSSRLHLILPFHPRMSNA